MSSSQRTSELSRIGALDGFRGLAIVAVIGFHYWPNVIQGGILGVLIFFVLSGYLITGLLSDEYTQSGRIDLRAFFVRRGLRLLPALYLMLAAFLAITYANPPWFNADLQGAVTGAALASLYLFNWISFVSLHIPHAMTPLWTLSVEEQFYLAWPFALAVILRRRARNAIAMVLVGGVTAGVVSIVAFTTFGVTSYYRTWTWIPALLAGACIALGVRQYPLPMSRRVGNFFALVVAVGLLTPSWNDRVVAYIVTIPVMSAAASVLILRLSAIPQWWLSRVLNSKPARFLGTRSYGLYLWNLVVLEAVKGFQLQKFWTPWVALAITVAVSEASYRFIERSALRLKGRLSWAQPRATIASEIIELSDLRSTAKQSRTKFIGKR